MSTYRAARSLRACWRAAWFSLVTAPSLVLFFLFMLLTFNNSLAGTFLDAARDLVVDAPPGKIWGCAPPLSTPVEKVMPQGNGIAAAPPDVRCERAAVDAIAWQKNVDRLIRNLYVTVAFAGAFFWWFLGSKPGVPEAAEWAGRKVKSLRKTVQEKE